MLLDGFVNLPIFFFFGLLYCTYIAFLTSGLSAIIPIISLPFKGLSSLDYIPTSTTSLDCTYNHNYIISPYTSNPGHYALQSTTSSYHHLEIHPNQLPLTFLPTHHHHVINLHPSLRHETKYTPFNIRALADYSYFAHDQSAPIFSGSFHTAGMIVIPCSMKTLAAINAGYGDDLIARAADVVLKERRRLVLEVRETVLGEIHLRNMLGLTGAGAVVCPTVPAWYIKPAGVEDLVEQMVGRMLDLFGIEVGG